MQSRQTGAIVCRSGGRESEVETDEGVMVIRRVHVAMRLEAPEDVREVVERVHGIFAMRCPLYRTLHTAIAFTTSYELVAASV